MLAMSGPVLVACETEQYCELCCQVLRQTSPGDYSSGWEYGSDIAEALWLQPLSLTLDVNTATGMGLMCVGNFRDQALTCMITEDALNHQGAAWRQSNYDTWDGSVPPGAGFAWSLAASVSDGASGVLVGAASGDFQPLWVSLAQTGGGESGVNNLEVENHYTLWNTEAGTTMDLAQQLQSATQLRAVAAHGRVSILMVATAQGADYAAPHARAVVLPLSDTPFSALITSGTQFGGSMALVPDAGYMAVTVDTTFNFASSSKGNAAVHIFQRDPAAASPTAKDAWVATGFAQVPTWTAEWTCNTRVAAAGYTIFFSASDPYNGCTDPATQVAQFTTSIVGSPAGTWGMSSSTIDVGAPVGDAMTAAANILAVPTQYPFTRSANDVAPSVFLLRPAFGEADGSSTVWQQRAELTNPAGTAVDTGFGAAVNIMVSSHSLGRVAVNAASDYAVVLVGAPFAGDGAGSVHVYDANSAASSNSVWTLTATLQPHAGASTAAACGMAIAVSPDHNVLVMGCPGDNAVHAFVRNTAAGISPGAAGAWLVDAVVTAPDSLPGDLLGSGLALGGDWLVVGAPGADVAGLSDFGLVHVFERVADAAGVSSWRSQGSLMPEHAAYEDGGRLFGNTTLYDSESGLFVVPAVSLQVPVWVGNYDQGKGMVLFFNASAAAAVHRQETLLDAAMASGCTTAPLSTRTLPMLLQDGEHTVPSGGLPIVAPCSMRPAPTSPTTTASPTLIASHHATTAFTMLHVRDTALTAANFTADGNGVARGVAVHASTRSTASLAASGMHLLRTSAGAVGRGGSLLLSGEGASASLVDTTCSDSSAGLGGGCLAAEAQSQLTAARVELTNCSSSRGGGLFLTNGATAHLASCTVRHSSGRVGGAIVVSEETTLTLQACSFLNNTATSGSGGALFMDTWSVVEASGCEWSGNVANYQGGAAFVGLSSSLTASDSTFMHGTATQGGGVAVSSAQATLTNCSLAHNYATDAAGGLWVGQSAQDTPTQLTDCTVEHNSAADSAGGLLATRGLVSLTRCALSHNTARAGSGGGGVARFSSQLTLQQSTVEANAATAGSAGGLHVSDSRLNADNVIVSGNSAGSGNSGGIGCLHGSTCTLANTALQGNTATEAGGSGGGMYVDSSTYTGNVVELHGNRATFGGGVACMVGSSCVMHDSSVTNNSASGHGGGGVGVDDSSLELARSNVTGNDASSGGGLACIGSSTCACSSTSFDANRALGDGGGISAVNSHVSMTGGSLSMNAAGGLSVGSGASQRRRLSPSASFSWGRGGGLQASMDQASRGAGMSVELTGVAIQDNVAPFGGAVSAAVDVDNTTCLASPTTCADEGAVSPAVSLHTGVSLSGNTATVGGPDAYWVHRPIGGVVGSSLDPARSATAPTTLQLTPSHVVVASGGTAPTVVWAAVDFFGNPATSAQLAAEAAAVRPLDTASTITLRGSTQASFSAVTGEAQFTSLVVAAPPGSTHLLEVYLTPNVAAMASAVVNITVSQCSPGSAPSSPTSHDCTPCTMQTFSADGLTCVPCAPGAVWLWLLAAPYIRLLTPALSLPVQEASHSQLVHTSARHACLAALWFLANAFPAKLAASAPTLQTAAAVPAHRAGWRLSLA